MITSLVTMQTGWRVPVSHVSKRLVRRLATTSHGLRLSLRTFAGRSVSSLSNRWKGAGVSTAALGLVGLLNSHTEEDPKVKKWVHFIEKLHQGNKDIPKPFHAVSTLVDKYSLKKTGTVLEVGCETGKNALALIQAGHQVTLLDIAPNAVNYTKENLAKHHADHGVVESIVGSIETLDPKYGPFKAVVGTFAFSFIPPHLFENVMKSNVLGRIEPEGFFVGGFFGTKHAWADDPNLTIVTQEKLTSVLKASGFTVCEMTEKIGDRPTLLNGRQTVHTISVIAKRSL